MSVWQYLFLTIAITYFGAHSLEPPVDVIKINTNLSSLSKNHCFKSSKTPNPRLINQVVLKKCCPIGLQLDLDEDSDSFCKVTNKTLAITLLRYSVKGRVNYYDEVSLVHQPTIVIDPPFVVPAVIDGTFFLSEKGTLLELVEETCQILEYKKYCIDTYNDSDHLSALVETSGKDAAIYILIPCMGTSIICLLFTIGVYLVVGTYSNLIGRSLLGVASFLLVQYGFYIVKYSHDEFDFTVVAVIKYSFIGAAFWFTVMWCDICWHVWMYLPSNRKRDKNNEFFLFASLVITLVIFMTALAYFGVNFKRKLLFNILIGIMLTICSGLCVASIIGFKNLTMARETACFLENQARTSLAASTISINKYSDNQIKYVQTMHVSAILLLGYQILCIIIKVSTKSNRIEKTFEMFNSLGGMLILIVFVAMPKHWAHVKTWWERRNNC